MGNLKEKISAFVFGKKFMVVVSFLGLYLLSAGVSMAVFTFLGKEPSFDSGLGDGLAGSRGRISDLPKTEECPLNGGMYSKVEREIWEGRRPIAAMVENHADSRPTSGLSKADVVYEAVAEGGITRFLAIFYCGSAGYDLKIAPVRSARVYFIDWASEYADFPIFMHVGGANNYSGDGSTTKEARALELLETLGWRVPRGNDFDTTYDSGYPVFWRNYERLDREVATEHTMMASLDEAYKQAEKRGYGPKNEDGDSWDENYVSWKFADDAASSGASEISFEFWSNKPDYNVTWKYDGGGNRYLRVNAGTDAVDLETKEKIYAKNVVVMFVKERGPVDKNLHMLYTTTGSGKAIIFQNGKAIEGTWEKDSRTDRTKFMDSDDKEISFVRGPIWIEAVPAGNEVAY